MIDPALLTGETARHSLPYLFAGQAQKEFTVNEALARIDMLLQPAVVRESASPPVAPVTGELFLVAESAIGAFSGHEDQIAGWDGQQWTFVAPVEGMTVVDLSNGQTLRFQSGWQRLLAPGLPSGGTTVDTQARQAIADLTEVLRAFGIFS